MEVVVSTLWHVEAHNLCLTQVNHQLSKTTEVGRGINLSLQPLKWGGQRITSQAKTSKDIKTWCRRQPSPFCVSSLKNEIEKSVGEGGHPYLTPILLLMKSERPWTMRRWPITNPQSLMMTTKRISKMSMSCHVTYGSQSLSRTSQTPFENPQNSRRHSKSNGRPPQ